ncbi:MAG: transglycosylase domain-containing protein, partial [Gammaproteobacteria bacterium]|nr:transglycosylase domain-containing protein [Gammaproteobacteria bacterium]
MSKRSNDYDDKYSPESSQNSRPRKKSLFRRFVKTVFLLGIAGVIFGGISIYGLYLYLTPNLPSIDSLKDVRFQVPLRIFSADGKLMGEFGEKRRIPLKYEEIPQDMVHAFLGAEDDRFFEHPGVDYQGILRAIAVMVTTGQKAQGGSTITMQVARNFFLSREKTFLRKFNEIFLSLQIEQELSKEEILTLYLNKIYLGNRSYGVGAAANIYYGKKIGELSLAEIAMIAGLPKAPSSYNPIANPTRALQRRNYVLRRMKDLNFISDQQYNQALTQPVTASLHKSQIELEAPYAAEMVRKDLTDRYGEDVYTDGYTVYTTLNSRLQEKANSAIRYGLLAYEERHGYRGAVQKTDDLDFADPGEWDGILAVTEAFPLLENGLVIDVAEDEAFVYLKSGRIAHLCWRGMKWAAPYIDGNRPGPKPETAFEILQAGDVIRMYDAGNGRWSLGQVPEVSGAL